MSTAKTQEKRTAEKMPTAKTQEKFTAESMIDGCWPGRLPQGGLKKRAGEPKGKNQNRLGVGEGAVQKYDRPMLAGEAKPRGPEEKTWRTERRELRSVGGLCKAPSKTLSADAGREGKAKWI